MKNVVVKHLIIGQQKAKHQLEQTQNNNNDNNGNSKDTNDIIFETKKKDTTRKTKTKLNTGPTPGSSLTTKSGPDQDRE